MTAAGEPRVVHVVGKGRSGSTLLDRALGALDGVTSVGEVFRLWSWGLGRADACGCGQPVPACEFWTAVLDRLPGGDRDVAIGTVAEAAASWRTAPMLLRARVPAWLREHHARMLRLYRAIAVTAGAATVVDSSKWPVPLQAVAPPAGPRPVLLHLVRDPRAVAFSWQTRRQYGFTATADEMPRFGAVSSSASWYLRNLLAELAGRRLAGRADVRRVRYEDLASEPRAVLGELAGVLGVALPDFPANHVPIGVSHVIGGNPTRPHGSSVAVVPDTRWMEQQRARDRVLVELATWPLRRRYGYTRAKSRS